MDDNFKDKFLNIMDKLDPYLSIGLTLIGLYLAGVNWHASVFLACSVHVYLYKLNLNTRRW